MSAVRQDSVSDYLGRILAILALSVPYFGLAVLVVVLPSIYFKWTPVWTYVPFTADPLENLKIMLVPALVFGVTRAGPIMRIMRSALLDVLRQDYIRTAWSKGLSERTIVLRHALKNAMIPVISLIGLQMPLYIGGSVIIESIFRLPGVGLFFFEALGQLDYPVVQSVNLIIAAMVVGPEPGHRPLLRVPRPADPVPLMSIATPPLDAALPPPGLRAAPRRARGTSTSGSRCCGASRSAPLGGVIVLAMLAAAVGADVISPYGFAADQPARALHRHEQRRTGSAPTSSAATC